MGRFEFERRVLGRSRDDAGRTIDPALPPPARLLALTLATYTDANLTVPAKFSPSLTELARVTGLSRTAVAKHLTTLEQAGWIRRDRPPVALARSRKQTTGYTLTGPSHAPDKPLTGAPDAPELVREARTASARGALNQSFQNYSISGDDPMLDDDDLLALFASSHPGRELEALDAARRRFTSEFGEAPTPARLAGWLRKCNPTIQLPKRDRPPCPDCDNTGWIEDNAGKPIAKCDHPNRKALSS